MYRRNVNVIDAFPLPSEDYRRNRRVRDSIEDRQDKDDATIELLARLVVLGILVTICLMVGAR